jgi:hypothetical protein
MDSVTVTVFLTLIAVAVGGFVTWLVARAYYEKASKDLRKEAETLRQLNILILRGMENAGLVKLTRDQAGNPSGLAFDAALSIGAKADAQFDAVVGKKP